MVHKLKVATKLTNSLSFWQPHCCCQEHEGCDETHQRLELLAAALLLLGR